jgi:molybdopterin synthase sulfur carrier subunit
MKVTVRYFARLREAAGQDKAAVELLDASATLASLLEQLGAGNEGIRAFLAEHPVLLAVNGEYAGRDRALEDGDEVALFPPVSGG